MKTNQAPVITIDGPSGSGKGTIAKKIAHRLGWHYLDSGALYRVLGFAVLQNNVDPDDHEQLKDLLAKLKIRIEIHGDDCNIYIGNTEISGKIRSEEVGHISSKISALPFVREALLEKQREFRQEPGLVTDGRDMGTVIFKDAELKIFMVADPKERAQRRYSELKNQGNDVSLPEIEQQLASRDQRDQQRAIAPTKPAQDAVIIDTTGKTIVEVQDEVMQHVAEIFGVS